MRRTGAASVGDLIDGGNGAKLDAWLLPGQSARKWYERGTSPVRGIAYMCSKREWWGKSGDVSLERATSRMNVVPARIA